MGLVGGEQWGNVGKVALSDLGDALSVAGRVCYGNGDDGCLS